MKNHEHDYAYFIGFFNKQFLFSIFFIFNPSPLDADGKVSTLTNI